MHNSWSDIWDVEKKAHTNTHRDEQRNMRNETCIRSILCALNLFSTFLCIHKITLPFSIFPEKWRKVQSKKKRDRELKWNGRERCWGKMKRERKRQWYRDGEWPKTRYDPACIQFNMPDFNLDIYLCIIFRLQKKKKYLNSKLARAKEASQSGELKNAYSNSEDESEEKNMLWHCMNYDAAKVLSTPARNSLKKNGWKL